MLTRNNAALDAQLEERPLAKKEKELQEHEIQENQQAEHLAVETASNVKEPSPKPEKHHKKALLKNDDYELVRIGKVCCAFLQFPVSVGLYYAYIQLLNEVHSRFFDAYDTRSPQNTRRKTIPASRSYDVTVRHILDLYLQELISLPAHHSSVEVRGL
jgi:RNA polymerase II subunit A-like phosphatase